MECCDARHEPLADHLLGPDVGGYHCQLGAFYQNADRRLTTMKSEQYEERIRRLYGVLREIAAGRLNALSAASAAREAVDKDGYLAEQYRREPGSVD